MPRAQRLYGYSAAALQAIRHAGTARSVERRSTIRRIVCQAANEFWGAHGTQLPPYVFRDHPVQEDDGPCTSDAWS